MPKKPNNSENYRARWYRDRYASDPQFRAAESSRKSDWLKSPQARELNAAASARWRNRKLRKFRVLYRPKDMDRLESMQQILRMARLPFSVRRRPDGVLLSYAA